MRRIVAVSLFLLLSLPSFARDPANAHNKIIADLDKAAVVGESTLLGSCRARSAGVGQVR